MRAFLCWGKNKLSWLRYMTLYSLKKLNPDLDITLYIYDVNASKKPWNDKVEQDFHNYKGKDYIDEVSKLGINVEEWEPPFELEGITPSHISNIFKWYELTTNGGLYFDMDILFIKPLDKLIELYNKYDTIFCIEPYLLIGVLGSNMYNEFFDCAYKSCVPNFNPERYQSLGVENIYKMLYGQFAYDGKNMDWGFILGRNIHADIIRRFDVNSVSFPKKWFYKYDHTNIEKVFKYRELDLTDIIGIHWYGGHVVSQQYNCKITPEYLKKDESVISQELKRLLS